MTPKQLRACLSAGAVSIDNPPAETVVASPREADSLDIQSPVPAAVLVPIVLTDAPYILLTRRTAHLRAHAGQVSFPGGRIDSQDASPEAAALRESQEEIGLDPGLVELSGRLMPLLTGTGYLVTPVLGLLAAPPPLDVSAHEVEAVFPFLVSVLLDPDAPQKKRARFRGVWRDFWVWPHPDHYIWGATAAILLQLAERLRHAA